MELWVMHEKRTASLVYDVFQRHCPSHTVLTTLSSKWVYLTVCALRDSTMRHGELTRRLEGISPKMLAQTLRELERDGIVNRRVYAVVPPKVEYSLTPLGDELSGLLSHIRTWAERHAPQILDARERFDREPS
jgi:DNA-binding HxlR family transcriptional regulator